MEGDDATDEGKVQVVGRSFCNSLELTIWTWAMRFWGTAKLATSKQAVTVRMDCHIRGRIIFPSATFELVASISNCLHPGTAR